MLLTFINFVVAGIQCSDARIVESAGMVIVRCERSGSLGTRTSFNITTTNGTATGQTTL